MTPYLTVVAPCYNEEEVLPEFYRRVRAMCEQLQTSYEIVLINNASEDRTWELMQGIAASDGNVVCVNMMRNHGHQLALTAGLHFCRGERIAILDADLQDPPELVPEMLRLMDAGADVVYGQRRKRAGETWFKRTTSALFYRLISRLSDTPIPLDTGDFRVMNRCILDQFLAMPERHRFIRGMIDWIGGKQVPLLYDRNARFAGETKYPLRHMLKFAWDAITGFSTRPLQAASFLGLIFAVIGLLLFGYSIVGWLTGSGVVGWTSLMGGIGLLGGVQLLVLGILGEYIGRLYEQTKGRPLFMIREVLNRQESDRLQTSFPTDRDARFGGVGAALSPVSKTSVTLPAARQSGEHAA